jgi:hypothetical protein
MKEDPRFFVECPKRQKQVVSLTTCSKCGYGIYDSQKKKPVCDLPRYLREGKKQGEASRP